MKKRFISVVTLIPVLFSYTFTISNNNISAKETVPCQMEYLNRGTVAVKKEDGVYISWRLLGTEEYEIAFDVYRDGIYRHCDGQYKLY